MKNLKKLFSNKFVLVILIVLIAVGSYFGYQRFKPKMPLQYATEAAQKTTISSSVTGTGQVSELDKVDLKPSISGPLTAINIKVGDKVKLGQVLVVINPKESQLALVQAQATLANAQSNYDSVVGGATQNDIQLSQNSVKQAEISYKNSQQNLENVKKTTAEAIAKAQKDLADLLIENGSVTTVTKRTTLVSTLQDKLNSNKSSLDSLDRVLNDTNLMYTFGAQDSTSATNAQASYDEAVQLATIANNSFAIAKQNQSDSNLETASQNAINALSKTATALDYTYTALLKTVVSDRLSQSQLDSYKSSVSGQLTTVNNGISSIKTDSQNLKTAVSDATDAVNDAKTNADQQVTSAQNQVDSSYNSLQNAKINYEKLVAPATSNEVIVARAQLRSAQTQYQQAQENVRNNTIVAPFDGQITVVNVKNGDQVTSATVVATIITDKKIAEVSLNEVNIAKVKLGQSVVLTFDAIEDLSLAGKIVEIDALGTVSQGVVTYGVKIAFDLENESIKPNMTVNASIITDVATDVIAVSSSAIKTNAAGSSYVEIMKNGATAPTQQAVETGIANDTLTQVVSGVAEGDMVVTQTIDPNKKTTTASSGSSTTRTNSGMGGLGIMGGGPR